MVGGKVASWSLSEVELLLDTDIANPNPVVVPVSDVVCDLQIGGLPMGQAHIPAGTQLAARATTRVPVPLKVPLSQMAALLAQGLERGTIRPYTAKCNLSIDLGQVTVKVPFEKAGWVDLVNHRLMLDEHTPEPVTPAPRGP